MFFAYFLVFSSLLSATCLDLKGYQKKPVLIEEAEYFSIDEYQVGKNKYFFISIRQPYNGAKEARQYLLGSAATQLCSKSVTFIKTPIHRLVATSTTHIEPILELGVEETLVAFSNTKFIFSSKVRKLIDEGQIKEVGSPVSAEVITSVSPDLVMAYAVSSPELEGLDKIERLKIPIIYNNDFKEKSPLARTQWRILFGYLYEKQKEAWEKYSQVKNNYLSLKKRIAKIKGEKPIVATGRNQQGTWIASGADSDLVQMIQDAGGDYLWKHKRGRENIRLTLEKAFLQLRSAKVWLPQTDWKSKSSALVEDQRYKNLELFNNGQTYNYNKRLSKNGGSDFWEKGMMRPDLLLEDLVRILHPSVLPPKELMWYQKL